MKRIKPFIVLLTLIVVVGCSSTPIIIWDFWGPTQPKNCYHRTAWTFQNCIYGCDDGECLRVDGVTHRMEGHSEPWYLIDGKISPVGESYISIAYLVTRLDCKTGKELPTSNKDRARFLVLVHKKMKTWEKWIALGSPMNLHDVFEALTVHK